MTIINGLGSAAAASRPTLRGTAPAGRFRVGASEAGAAQAAPAGGAEVSLSAMLALQEAQTDAPATPAEADAARDRAARRQGEDILAELSGLQRDLLGQGGASSLSRLAGLAREMPQAADPRLRDVMQAIGLRAQVELARQQHG